MASNVIFLDDSQTSLGTFRSGFEAPCDSSEFSDAKNDFFDQFLLSRINDSTSYFYSWFCKHFRVKLSMASASCPICLETVENSIELHCGHVFCRSCLSISAKSNLDSCAICRKKQTLNPDLLKERFNLKRMENLAQRLMNISNYKNDPLGHSKVQVSIPRVRAQSCEIQKLPDEFERPKNCFVGSFPYFQSEEKKQSMASCSSDDVVKPVKVADDIGEKSVQNLSENYQKLMEIAMNSDIGDIPVYQLSKNFHYLLNFASNKDIGNESIKKLSKNYQNLLNLATSEDVGSFPSEKLSENYQSLMNIRAPSKSSSRGIEEVFESDVGDLSNIKLIERWEILVKRAS
mmetsp:Transcript_4021/g.5539  ORF Transcript_4021/g.5539 Transcript_4021/m.5539 type:complete len:346 (-) Transcript_4021:78-1115(-)|eukprot:CAMPEP_0171472736 /NCGR_PEP_ID=MMETSP0946-20130122/1444_1 /TAXON_ID=109269 /ORGANISM="Vaucheria litorea, Strain CCMP2940" /LENGTH=345 /DNA_ID=CAMNT_0012002407 /DNA_START=31 /DNA_END=1068 /DNA_ORIENTATION=+